MTKPTPDIPILDDNAVIEIEARLKEWDGGAQHPASWNNVRALCQTVRALRAENKRVYTPSICEALRLLDDAGYGKEVPNSLSEMIKKVLAQLEQVTKERDDARSALDDANAADIEIAAASRRSACVEKVKALSTKKMAQYDLDHERYGHLLEQAIALDEAAVELESVSIQEQEK